MCIRKRRWKESWKGKGEKKRMGGFWDGIK